MSDKNTNIENAPSKKGIGGKIVSVLSTVFVYLLAVCIVIAALLFASDNSPQKSVFGYRYYTVLTPSMEPELGVGDMVIVKLADADDIEVGDVITFNPSSDTDTYLTHRVTAKYENYEGTGVTCFTTKGDANDSEDGFLLDEDRVIGKVVLHIPYLGYIVRFIQLRWYYVVPLIILIFIFFRLLRIYFTADEEEEPSAEHKEYEGVGESEKLKDLERTTKARDAPADDADTPEDETPTRLTS